jgi:hypothetical protein
MYKLVYQPAAAGDTFPAPFLGFPRFSRLFLGTLGITGGGSRNQKSKIENQKWF